MVSADFVVAATSIPLGVTAGMFLVMYKRQHELPAVILTVVGTTAITYVSLSLVVSTIATLL